MDHFNNGANLGGWLSQYRQYDHEHFRGFITRHDLEQIASWGMDHVRLPFDYPVLESDSAPGHYKESGFVYIDACLDWCKEFGLGLILDLHHAPGYTFTNTLRPETEHLNTLFNQEEAQERFMALWQAVARRYKNAGVPLIHELLNEVVLPDSAPWNSLAQRTVQAIRQIDPAIPIMIGGNHYNAASELKNLELVDDPAVCHTFHFYEPLLFTHQKARWVRAAVDYDQELDYPGEFTGLGAFLERFPQWQETYREQAGRPLDRELVREFLQPALDWLEQTKLPLYCGEFGVIDHAPRPSIRRWHADFISMLREHGIGRAVWSYKQMGFGLVDGAGRVVDEELVRICSQP